MPKRKAARKDGLLDIQPSLLGSLPRPSDPEQSSVWTAKVRERLGELQGAICKLESERQVLLSLLNDASNDITEVSDAAGSRCKVCPVGEGPPPASTDALWNAAQGFPSDVLVNNINKTSIHPALKYDVKILSAPLEPSNSADLSGMTSEEPRCTRELEREALETPSAAAAVTALSSKADVEEMEKPDHENNAQQMFESIDSMAFSHASHGFSALGRDDGTDVNMLALPRSPSISSTILLSSEDEGEVQQAQGRTCKTCCTVRSLTSTYIDYQRSKKCPHVHCHGRCNHYHFHDDH